MKLDNTFYKEIENLVANCLVRDTEEKTDKDFGEGKPKFDFPECNIKKNIEYIQSYIKNDNIFKNCKEPYIKQIDQKGFIDNKKIYIDSKIYIENQQIIKNNSYDYEDDIIKGFTKNRLLDY